ncbi:multidrug effflux MFS transporter [Salipiger sp. PrR002]|uniref:multidrug effflux MFS transporter n=1 Tax=Salipiger sp. PrR002 TaxID=2706489 RepID=UPI0013BCF247|nr:multidrug effflux MFS transporter [Salipiger sp. PrR002]NDV98747.1 multidrug effflux MFS transporter [Salipiger sp. PrR002]NDW55484.1 multidrug effflux MFS transporter [Salipiger sp. PrR004]
MQQPQPASSPPISLSQGRRTAITATLALLSIFPPLATDMYLAAMGDIAEAFGTSHSTIELSLSLFFLGLCLGQLVMGPLLDAYGRKGPLLAGVALFSGCSVALLMVEDIAVFNALRLLQAVGACAGMVVGRAVVNDLYEGRQAAKAMTVLVMLMTLGPIVSPTLGSLLLEGFGWRAIFVAMVLVGLLALALSALVIPETLPRERRVSAPFRSAARTAGHLLSRREFVVPALVAGLIQGGMFAFITGSSGVFQGVFGLSSLSYGLLFAAIAAALFLSGQLNNKLLDRFDPARIMAAGLPVYALAGLALVVLSGTEALWVFVAPLWLAIGMVGLLSANAMAITMGAAREGAGIGSALLGAIQFGLAFSVSSCVALGGSGTPLPMALGLLVPASLAWLLWTVGRRGQGAEAEMVEA